MLSAVTVFPAASWIVAVSTRAEPEASEEVEPVSAIWAAVPWVTVKAPRVPVVRPEAVACIVTAPARTPVTVFVATPLEAVEAPVPLTEPAPEAWVKLTEVELSDVTVFPAASWTVAVSTRVAPEVRFAVEPVRATCAAAPGSTVNAPSVPVVRPEAVACMVTVPARAPVTVFVATPELAVAAPVPVTVPVPEALVKLTEVVLSPVTTLPAASLIVAVRSLVEPEVRFAVEPVSTMSAAAPGSTVKAPRVPVVSPLAVACMATVPTSAPVIVFVATPALAVAAPVPVTVPVPEALVKLTEVVLSPVTVLPAASLIVAVSRRVLPDVRLAVEPLRTMSAAAPWTTVKAPIVPVVSPDAVACIDTEPTRTAVTVLVATPPLTVTAPVPETEPAPEAWVKLTEVELSAVTVFPAASWTVAVSSRVDAGGEVGRRAGQRDLSRGAVGDGEGAEGAGGEAARRRLHRDRAHELAGQRLGGDAAGDGDRAGPADGAGAGSLREGDGRGAVGGDRVPGGVLDGRGQDPVRARGQARRRAGQRHLGRRCRGRR